MDRFKFFWDTMELCDWNQEGDDDKVLMPVIRFLSNQNDSVIFEFHDQMSELLYELDTRTLFEQYQKEFGYSSGDAFLYSRCVALINGPQFYENAKKGKQKNIWNMEFEALLYVPAKAWAIKHEKDADEFPHFSPLSYETGSNKDAWM